MAKSKENMKRILEATGLYLLPGNSPMDFELDAYEAGFALVWEALETLRNNLFIATASREALAERELSFRPTPMKGSLEECRQMLFVRGGIRPQDITEQQIAASLIAAGVDGKMILNGNKIIIHPIRLVGITFEEASRELDLLLPVHIPWEFELVVNWEIFDGRRKNFAELDSDALTWRQIEALTFKDL